MKALTPQKRLQVGMRFHYLNMLCFLSLQRSGSSNNTDHTAADRVPSKKG